MADVVPFVIDGQPWEAHHVERLGHRHVSFYCAAPHSCVRFQIEAEPILALLRDPECCAQIVCVYLRGVGAGREIGAKHLAERLRDMLGAAPASGAGT